MKTPAIVSLVVALASSALAQDFSTTLPRQPRGDENFVIEQPRGGGVLQRAARSRNPVQMINPRAPRAYGDARDLLVYDQNQPSTRETLRPRPIAVTLFSFEF
jgi:hypothetical protein